MIGETRLWRRLFSLERRMAGEASTKRKIAATVAQSDTARIDAAVLLAERNLDDPASTGTKSLTDEQIARKCGVSRSTLYRWRTNDPEFAALVGDAEGQIKAEALRVPSANVHHRIKALDRIAAGILRMIAARAERHTAAIEQTAATDSGSAAMREIMGNTTPAEAATGLLVSQPKISANGTVVTEWAFDASPIRELRETYKHIAQQLKQWEEGYSVNHTVSDMHDERLDALSVTQLEAIDRIIAGES